MKKKYCVGKRKIMQYCSILVVKIVKVNMFTADRMITSIVMGNSSTGVGKQRRNNDNEWLSMIVVAAVGRCVFISYLYNIYVCIGCRFSYTHRALFVNLRPFLRATILVCRTENIHKKLYNFNLQIYNFNLHDVIKYLYYIFL